MALPYCHGEIEASKVFVKCLLYLKTLLKNERQSETERKRQRWRGQEEKEKFQKREILSEYF